MRRFISLFAGIGGFDLGFERAGWSCVASCEIELMARKVYAARFERPVTWEDVNEIRPEDVPESEAWCFGWPCQDNSVAGKRAGNTAGKRSGLIYRVLALFDALPQERRPRWLVGENVPGLLSVGRGRDFGELLAALDDRGFGWAWRVLDARYFGVAQRRRRVFLAVDTRGGLRVAEEVLALAEGVRGRAPARGQARSKAAAAPRGGADAHRVAGTLGAHASGGYDPADLERCGAIVWDGQQITPKHNRAKVEPGAPAPTLTQGSDLTIATLTYARAMGQTDDGPRRLTPLECERLQGFPDGWTCLCGVQPYSTAACRCSDGYRYRALGNAVAVPVVEWIARRLGGGRCTTTRGGTSTSLCACSPSRWRPRGACSRSSTSPSSARAATSSSSGA